MLKNEILKLTELQNNPKFSKLSLDKEKDFDKFFESLPTIQKIFIAQNLLKEMNSKKDIFLENQKNMIKKIDSNSYKYYINTILIKQILDYCKLGVPEKKKNYILLEDEEANNVLHNYEDEVEKNFITNFFIHIRNDNALMLKIIQEIDIKDYEQLAYFLTHLLYEDTTISNFKQDELILMLYLVMEDTIDNKFQNDFSIEFLNKLNSEKSNYFLYHFLKNFTTKIEVRNFLSNIFQDLILDLEEKNIKLVLDVISLIKEGKKYIEEKNNTNELRKKSIINNDENKLKENDINYRRTKSMPLQLNSINLIKKENNENDIDIFSFVIKNNLTKFDLQTKLTDLNNKGENRTEMENSFMEFYLFLNKEFPKDKKEIFSSGIILEYLIDKKEEKKFSSEDKSKIIDNIYINNVMIIMNFIKNLFKKILQSLNSLPYSIKCIFFFIDKLISKKYSNNITHYQFTLLKLNIFFEVFIIPILENPLSNGCITDFVLSNNTLENLKIISKVVEQFISGNLFKRFAKKMQYFTIFNRFIIDEMENFLNIGIEIDKNIINKFEPPNVVMKLIELKDKNNNYSYLNERNINYDFFNFNKNENIQYQSVCFSYSDLLMFIKIFEKINLDEYFKNNYHIKSDFALTKKYKSFFSGRYDDNLKKNKKEYLFISNLKYKESFLNEIKAVTEKHYENYFESQRNNSEIPEDILLFKKCFIEILIFINKVNKENFNSFIKCKDELELTSNSLINKYFLQQKFQKNYNSSYKKDNNNIILDANNGFNNNKNYCMKSCLSYDLMEDANFLEEILPRIITLIKYEIGNSSDNKKYERIKFCITYVQLHINDLPVQYKVNNFSYLFIDMIEDIQNLIASLKNNLLNQFYHKIRGGDKLNLFFSKYSSQINLMEKYYIINYIFHKIAPKNFQPSSSGNSIYEFIKKFRDFTKNSMEIDDLLLEEKKEGIPEMIR